MVAKLKTVTLHYQMCGLEYVFLEGVRVRHTEHGDAIDADLGRIEKEIASEIVRRGVPIRGAEVRFLRKTLGLSLERFGRLLGLTAPAILKWERAREKRLDPTNEVSVRALVAELMNILLEGRFSVLRGNQHTPVRLALEVVP
jgi:putative transcriptional regulator